MLGLHCIVARGFRSHYSRSFGIARELALSTHGILLVQQSAVSQLQFCIVCSAQSSHIMCVFIAVRRRSRERENNFMCSYALSASALCTTLRCIKHRHSTHKHTHSRTNNKKVLASSPLLLHRQRACDVQYWNSFNSSMFFAQFPLREVSLGHTYSLLVQSNMWVQTYDERILETNWNKYYFYFLFVCVCCCQCGAGSSLLSMCRRIADWIESGAKKSAFFKMQIWWNENCSETENEIGTRATARWRPFKIRSFSHEEEGREHEISKWRPFVLVAWPGQKRVVIYVYACIRDFREPKKGSPLLKSATKLPPDRTRYPHPAFGPLHTPSAP